MNKTLLAKRYKAERRFRRYGQIAIATALISLVFLLSTIVMRGWQGFLHTQISLPLTIDSSVGDNTKDIRHADFSPFIKQALLKQFPEVKDKRQIRALVGLISSGALQEIRNHVIANPQIIGKETVFWLSASDRVDRYIKSGSDKLNPDQVLWVTKLKEQGDIKLTWNNYFFTSGDSREPELAGFAASMIGSLFTLLSCMLVALPIGVMTAIYLEEFAPSGKITDLIELNINNLAAVPSVVYGLLGLAVYLNLFGVPRSASLAGGLTLALMILPTIIIATRASLRAVPDSIRDAARALGASPLQVVLHHTFPLAIPGIMTGTILGIARAMGETAPLLMIGMVAFIVDIPRNPLDPATAMPVQIYLWATSPEESFVEKTAAGIMVLLVALITLNSAAIFIRKRFEHHW